VRRLEGERDGARARALEAVAAIREAYREGYDVGGGAVSSYERGGGYLTDSEQWPESDSRRSADALTAALAKGDREADEEGT
jgi:hypothetical protein